MDGQVVLRERDHVAAIIKKAGEHQFKMAVPNDAVENAFLRDKVALILDHKRPGLAQLDRVPDFGVTFVPDGQRVDCPLEGFNQCLGGGQFRQVA